MHTVVTLGWLAILGARKDVARKVRLIYEQRSASSGIEHALASTTDIDACAFSLLHLIDENNVSTPVMSPHQVAELSRLVERCEEAGAREFRLLPLSELVSISTDDRPYRIPVELNKRIALIAYERTRESNALMRYMTKDQVIELCDHILE